MEQAHALRRTDILEATSRALLSTPGSQELQSIGMYYQALCVHRLGKGNIDQAGHLLEDVADDAPPGYRARALISLGANSFRKGNHRAAISFYLEALSFVRHSRLSDYTAVIRAQSDIATIRGLEGNHLEALSILNNVRPIAKALRATHPHLYYD